MGPLVLLGKCNALSPGSFEPYATGHIALFEQGLLSIIPVASTQSLRGRGKAGFVSIRQISGSRRDSWSGRDCHFGMIKYRYRLYG